MTGDTDAAEVARIRDMASAQGLPLKVVTPGNARLPELYRAALVLIRPDQHVAWRGDSAPGPEVIARITGQRVPAEA